MKPKKYKFKKKGYKCNMKVTSKSKLPKATHKTYTM